MSKNRDEMATLYGDGSDEEKRPMRSRSSALEYHYTILHLDEYITEHSDVIEVGCATGYYAFHWHGKYRTYTGVDLHPPHVERFGQKIMEKRLDNVICQIGDASDLSKFQDESFDVALCLGPMYHLPLSDQQAAFSECCRVCKKGGIVAFSYICQVGVYAGGVIMSGPGGFYPNARANEYVLKQQRDDMRPDTFFYTMPESMEALAKTHGLKKLKNLGTDFFITMPIVDAMDDEAFSVMRPLYDMMATHESCTGMSNHALLICRKP